MVVVVVVQVPRVRGVVSQWLSWHEMALAWAGATPAAAGRVGGHAMMPELTQSALQRAVGDLKPKTSRTKDGETSPSAVPKPPGQQRSTTVCLTYIFLYSPTSAVCRLYRITTRRPRIHKSVLCHIRTRVFIVPKQKNRNYQNEHACACEIK